MRYKILFLAAAFSIFFYIVPKAQNKAMDISVKVYGGYGALTPHGDFFTDFTSNATGAFHNIKYGFGNGVHAGIGASVKLNETIRLGMDVDYLNGHKTATNNTNGDTVMGTFTAKHSVLSLIPNISFRLCNHPGYTVYNTIGIITAVKTTTEFDYTTQSASGKGTDFVKFKYGLNIGLQEAFGVQFHIVKNIRGFAEINGYYLPADPKSSQSTGTFYSPSGSVASVFNQNITFNAALHANYSGMNQSNGNTYGFTGTSSPELQRIFSIGLNAGVIIDLNQTVSSAPVRTSKVRRDKGKSWWLKVSGGYSVFNPGSDRLFESPGWIFNPGNNGVVPLNSNGRYGAGFYVGAELQKELSQLLTGGIAIDHLFGKELSADGSYLPDYTAPDSYSQTGKLSFWTAVPNLSFKVFSHADYYIYSKVGVILAFGTQYSSSGVDSFFFIKQKNIYNDQFKYGLDWGIQIAAGIQFKLGSNLNGFAELNNNFLSVAPNSFSFQNKVYNNNRMLYIVDNKFVTFIKSQTGNQTAQLTSTTSGGVSTTNETSSQPAIYQHANSTVLRVGIAFKIK